MDQGTLACLSVRAQLTEARVGARRRRRTRRRARGRGQLPLKIGSALFEFSLLKILQQKWTKWIIGKF
jgi:hypothetical protein